MWVIPNDYVQRRAVSRRGERLLSNGDLSAHEPDQTVDHRCAVTLDRWTGRQGCRGGHPAKPRRVKSMTVAPRTPVKNLMNAAI